MAKYQTIIINHIEIKCTIIYQKNICTFKFEKKKKYTIFAKQI